MVIVVNDTAIANVTVSSGACGWNIAFVAKIAEFLHNWIDTWLSETACLHF